jgi:hypothetical protein
MTIPIEDQIHTLKTYVKEYKLLKDDALFNLIQDSFKIQKSNEIELSFFKSDLRDKTINYIEDKQYYDLVAIINSDSYKIYQLFNQNKKEITKEDIYRLNVPTIVKENFWNYAERESLSDALEYFRIMERPTYKTVARSTETEELYYMQKVIKSIILNRSDIDENSLNFIRARRTKKQKDPACFDGNCLEKNIINGKIAIFGREVE